MSDEGNQENHEQNEEISVEDLIQQVVSQTRDDDLRMLKTLIEEVRNGAKELGFNSEWNLQRVKYEFYSNTIILCAFLGFAFIIGLGLFFLVEAGRIDSTTFSTLIAVLLGAVLDRSLQLKRRTQ